MGLLFPNFIFLLVHSTTIYLKKRCIWNQNPSFSASKAKSRQPLSETIDTDKILIQVSISLV